MRGSEEVARGASEELDGLRAGIDAVDEKIVGLLDERARLVRRVGEIKSRDGLDTYVPARERRVLDRVADLGSGDFPERGLEAVFREIISTSIAMEAPLKVAYLGPESTFTHEAAQRAFGSSVSLVAGATVAEVFARVESGEAQHGVVPVENSMEGAVTHTLDELLASPLRVCGEVYLPIVQNLLSNETSPGEVRRILSHPMALAQAGAWLRRELPGVEVAEVESTGEAARRASEEAGVAAVGGALAAEAYGLNVLARGIQEARTNTTRFVVLGREWAGRTGKDKTSVVFSFRDRPGGLADALLAFSEEGINMTRIESRPSRREAWTYVFLVDFRGHPEDEKVKRAFAKLDERCTYVRTFGAYPEVHNEVSPALAP